MSKYALFNGCSFVWGDELADPQGSRFSRLISDELGIREVNLSVRGASNDRIFRTTIDHMTSMTSKPEFMIIAWSGTDRFELFSSLKEDRHGGVLMQCSYSRVKNKEFEHITKPLESYFRSIVTDEYDSIRTLNYMATIQLLCRTMGIPLLQFQFAHRHKIIADRILNDMYFTAKMKEFHKYYKSKIDALAEYSTYGLTNEYNLLEMSVGIKDVEIRTGYYGHPREKSQVLYKDFMIEQLRKHYDFRVQ